MYIYEAPVAQLFNSYFCSNTSCAIIRWQSWPAL